MDVETQDENDIVIELRNVNKIFRFQPDLKQILTTLNPFKNGAKEGHTHQSLKDINLKIRKGESIGIIGNNGHGKSTLLKIIYGVIQPTSGQVITKGHVAALLELGAGLHPQLTGRKNLFFYGHLLGLTHKQIEAQIDHIIDFADIGEYINHPVRTYSSGMFIRLAFSASLFFNPDILLIDEALAVGDAEFQMKCFNQLNQFKEQKKTILFVSHSLDQIIDFSNKVIVVDKGKIIYFGPTKKGVDLYKKITTKHFLEHQPSGDNTLNHNIESKLSQFKVYYPIPPLSQDYGIKTALIYDYGIFNEQGNIVNKLTNRNKYSIRLFIYFKKALIDPIFAFSIKDTQGREVTGSNTSYEHMGLYEFQEKDKICLEFNWCSNIKSGQYFLSLAIVGFQNGKHHTIHRLFDILSFEVISHHRFVGIVDPNVSTHIYHHDPLKNKPIPGPNQYA